MQGKTSYQSKCVQITLYAALLLLFSLTSRAAAVDCGALGGSINASSECEINAPVLMKSGSFTLNETLRITGTGSIEVPHSTTLDITTTSGDIIVESGARIFSAQTSGGSCASQQSADIVLNAAGDISVAAGAIIKTEAVCSAGDITLAANGNIDVNGTIESLSSLSGTRRPGGGAISVDAFLNLTLSSTGVIRSMAVAPGGDPGADLIHLEGCEVILSGLVESSGDGHGVPNNPPNRCGPGHDPNSTACVEVLAGDRLFIDGKIKANTGGGGTIGTSWVDLFARGPITIVGGSTSPTIGGTKNADVAVQANGLDGPNAGDDGGTITVISTEDTISAMGFAFQASGNVGDFVAAINGAQGGVIDLQAADDVDLQGAFLEATGSTTGGVAKAGGMVFVRSVSTSSTDDILLDSDSQIDVTGGGTAGTVTLTECGTTTVPAGSVIPVSATTVSDCSQAAPSLSVTLPLCPCDMAQSATCDPPGPFTPSGFTNMRECRDSSDLSLLCTFCGDGVVQTGEQCDDGNDIDTDSCNNLCLPVNMACANAQNETCNPPGLFTPSGFTNMRECRDSQDTSLLCTFCGDGEVQTGEECDDGNDVDTDTCNNMCQAAPTCGDGMLDPGEACDEGMNGGLFTPSGFSSQRVCAGTSEAAPCTFCGDGVVQAGEDCDDGNDVDVGDSCPNSCQVITTACANAQSATCDMPGTSFVPSVSGFTTMRECRDSSDLSLLCTFCGDGVIQTGEECDDGNDIDTDSCSNSCVSAPLCPNNTVDPGETCDPPGLFFPSTPTNPTDLATQRLCRSPSVITQTISRQVFSLNPTPAPLNNTVNSYGCTYCGDNIVQAGAGEQCDDGNDVDTDSCNNMCQTVQTCGDGMLDPGEACDEGMNGGLFTPSGFSSQRECAGTSESVPCTFCGDGVVQAANGEECDDGNDIDGDGCDSACADEAVMCPAPVAQLSEGYILGDPAVGKLLPYYRAEGTLATVLGIENTTGSAGPSAGYDVNVHVTVLDEQSVEVVNFDLCLSPFDFGFIVLQEPEANPSQLAERIQKIQKVAFLSVDGTGIPNEGYVSVAATEIFASRGGSCTTVITECPTLATWAILQDVGSGFFGTEIPTPTANVDPTSGAVSGGAGALGIIPEASTVIARFDVNPDFDINTDVYIWLENNAADSTSDAHEPTLRALLDCEDELEISTMISIPNEINVIDPANLAGTGLCTEDGQYRGVLRFEMPAEGFVWSHISQANQHFRENFLGYNLGPAVP